MRQTFSRPLFFVWIRRRSAFSAFLPAQRAQRSKQFNLARNFNLDRNFLSRSNISISTSRFPNKKIGPRWVARSKISFSLEIFNLARHLEFLLILGPSGRGSPNFKMWKIQPTGFMLTGIRCDGLSGSLRMVLEPDQNWETWVSDVVKRRTCYKPQNPEKLKYGKSRSKVGFPEIRKVGQK